MKTTIAIIRLVLRTNKVLSTGDHPIMLRCSFSGMKEVSTGYSCSIKYWDKKNECIKKGYSNYILINQELKKLKDEAISRRDRYIANNEVYSPSMILDRSDRFNAVTNDLGGLIQRYINERGLENKTIEKWNIIKRNIREFAGRDILVNEIDEAFCRRYARWLEDRGLSSGSIRSYLGKVGAIVHYAISLGMVVNYPFTRWKYHQEYRESKSELYIHSRSMDVMKEMLLDELIEEVLVLLVNQGHYILVRPSLIVSVITFLIDQSIIPVEANSMFIFPFLFARVEYSIIWQPFDCLWLVKVMYYNNIPVIKD